LYQVFSALKPWRMKNPSPSGWPGLPIGYEYSNAAAGTIAGTAVGVTVGKGAGTAVGRRVTAVAGTVAAAVGSACALGVGTTAAGIGVERELHPHSRISVISRIRNV
jgi:hypothetical protein